LNKSFGVPIAKEMDEVVLYDAEVLLYIDDIVREEVSREVKRVSKT
jgi:hypothetical protein